MNAKEIVHQWHTVWREDPAAANERYLHKDIKVLLPGMKAIKGWDNANAHFLRVASAVNLPQPYTAEETQYLVYFLDGDRVARRFRCVYHNKDGSTMDMMVFNFYVVRDGKILHFEEHYDTYYRFTTTGKQPDDRNELDPTEYLV